MGYLIGIDEVGRGCWAGPLLVVAARQNGELPEGVRDSKLMSKIQRWQIYELLHTCCDFGEGWVSNVEIDSMGLARALKLGVARSLRQVAAGTDENIIIDGKINYIPKKYTDSKAVIKADNSVPIVSAASIYAKVKRDEYMQKLSKTYPNYFFEKHVGYGTPQHQNALKLFGAIPKHHRYSFSPIKSLVRQ